MEDITQIMQDIHHPTAPERRLKARFWVMWNDGPSKGIPTAEDVLDLVGTASLSTKVNNGAFLSWFLNDYEAAEQLAYLSQVSLGVLEDIIVNEGEKTSDRLKAISSVLDLVKATKKEDKDQDSDPFANMSEEEIDKFIASQTKVIKPT